MIIIIIILQLYLIIIIIIGSNRISSFNTKASEMYYLRNLSHSVLQVDVTSMKSYDFGQLWRVTKYMELLTALTTILLSLHYLLQYVNCYLLLWSTRKLVWLKYLNMRQFQSEADQSQCSAPVNWLDLNLAVRCRDTVWYCIRLHWGVGSQMSFYTSVHLSYEDGKTRTWMPPCSTFVGNKLATCEEWCVSSSSKQQTV